MRKAPLILLCGLTGLAGLAGLLGLGGCAGQTTPRVDSASPAATQMADSRSARQQGAARLVAESARTLRELRAADASKSLETSLREAQALVILPGVYRAGFLYTLHAGDGVLVARRPDGGWGAPVFVTLAGAGYGVQAGLERSRLVLALNDEAMLERILSGSLSLDASAGFDILGVREENTRGNLVTNKPVEAYSDGVGIMAGVGMNGGGIGVNESLTRLYHGRPEGRLEDILAGTSAPGVESFELWSALVTEGSGPLIIRPAAHAQKR